MTRNICVIPARGGSEGIEKKNLTILDGKPLLTYTIEHALQSEVIDEVYVSTEDLEIANVATESGAKVIDRPERMAQKWSSSIEANSTDIVFFYQCTSPLRADHHTNEAYGHFMAYDLDSLFSACKTQQFIWRQDERSFYDYKHRPMRQDKVPVILENGSFYISKAWCYLSHNVRLFGKIGHYVQPWIYGFEIDDMEDLKACGYLMQYEQ